MSVAGVNASAFVERGLYRGCGAVWCCVAGVNASAFVERNIVNRDRSPHRCVAGVNASAFVERRKPLPKRRPMDECSWG